MIDSNGYLYYSKQQKTNLQINATTISLYIVYIISLYIVVYMYIFPVSALFYFILLSTLIFHLYIYLYLLFPFILYFYLYFAGRICNKNILPPGINKVF